METNESLTPAKKMLFSHAVLESVELAKTHSKQIAFFLIVIVTSMTFIEPLISPMFGSLSYLFSIVVYIAILIAFISLFVTIKAAYGNTTLGIKEAIIASLSYIFKVIFFFIIVVMLSSIMSPVILLAAFLGMNLVMYLIILSIIVSITGVSLVFILHSIIQNDMKIGQSIKHTFSIISSNIVQIVFLILFISILTSGMGYLVWSIFKTPFGLAYNLVTNAVSGIMLCILVFITAAMFLQTKQR